MQILYRIIYSSAVNYALRNLNKIVSILIPKIIRIPPSGNISISVNEKKIKLYTNQTSYVTYVLYWQGVKSFEYSSIFISLIKKMNLFYDIGANIGYYSLIAASQNPHMKIKAFEPAFGCSHYLKKNIKKNNFKNIQIETLAISDKSEILDFYEVNNLKYTYLIHNLSGEGNTGTKKGERDFKIIKVNAVSLTEYSHQQNDQQIDLIKIDTEGSEYQILNEARELLLKQKPIVICETLFNRIEDKLEHLFSSLGYQFYQPFNGKLYQTKSISRENDDGIRDCFFVHPDKAHLIDEYVQK